jgi:hypothetical protein
MTRLRSEHRHRLWSDLGVERLASYKNWWLFYQGLSDLGGWATGYTTANWQGPALACPDIWGLFPSHEVFQFVFLARYRYLGWAENRNAQFLPWRYSSHACWMIVWIRPWMNISCLQEFILERFHLLWLVRGGSDTWLFWSAWQKRNSTFWIQGPLFIAIFMRGNDDKTWDSS